MIFENIRLVLAAFFLLAGIISAAISILGVFRFHFVMNRMHCAAILDTVSMTLIFAGLILLSWDMQYIPKLLAALLMLWVGSPAASHLVGKMEISIDETAAKHVHTEEDTHESH